MTTIDTNSTARTLTIPNLVNGQIYRARVSAVNNYGQGPFANWIQVTPSEFAIDQYYYDNILLMHFNDSRTGTYDQYGDYVSLFMRMNGTDNSTTFIDSSSYSNTITAYGSAKITTFSSTFGETSAQLIGTASYLTLPTNTQLSLGTEDFTIECWIYLNAYSNNAFWESNEMGTQGYRGNGFIWYTSNGYVYIFRSGQNILVTSEQNTIPLNAWVHISLVRLSGTTTFYVNGVAKASTTTSYNDTNGGRVIGAFCDDANSSPNMRIDDFRVTKGIARYTSSFTPPSAAFPSILPLFVDSSPYQRQIIPYGNATINSLQSKWGGFSVLLGGGSENLLSVPNSSDFDFGANDFTIEFWLYFIQTGTQFQLFARAGNQSGGLTPLFLEKTEADTIAMSWSTNGSNWVRSGSGAVGGTTLLMPSTWNHIALSRSSGTFRIHINGVLDFTDSSSSEALQNGGDGLSIGVWKKYPNNNGPFYIDDLRITRGVARYLADFNSPVAPFPDLGPAPTVPSVPLNLISSEDQGIVSLSWNKPLTPKTIDNRAPISYYGVEYSNDGGSSWTESEFVTPTTDPYFANVATLLNMDGVGSTFTDLSLSPKTITSFGGASQSFAQNKWGSKSLYLNGNGQYLTINNINGLSGDFAIEFWLRWESLGSSIRAIIAGSSSNTQLFISTRADGNGLRAGLVGVAEYATASYVWSTNVWYHVALSRTSGTWKFYINGANVTDGEFNNTTTFSGEMRIGAAENGAYNPNAYIDDLRITVGSNRGYNGSTITVPTTAFFSNQPSLTRNISGLLSGNPYLFRVRAQNSVGFGNYSSTSDISTLSNAPSGVGAIPDDSQAFVSWTAPTPNNSTIRDYAIQYSSDSGTSWSTYPHSPSTNTLINVTGLNNTLNYSFKVAAVNFAGTGIYSDSSPTITVAPRSDDLYNKTRILLHLDSN